LINVTKLTKNGHKLLTAY